MTGLEAAAILAKYGPAALKLYYELVALKDAQVTPEKWQELLDNNLTYDEQMNRVGPSE